MSDEQWRIIDYGDRYVDIAAGARTVAHGVLSAEADQIVREHNAALAAAGAEPTAPDAQLRAATARLVKVHDEALAVDENANPAQWGRIGREMDAAVEQCRAALAESGAVSAGAPPAPPDD